MTEPSSGQVGETRIQESWPAVLMGLPRFIVLPNGSSRDARLAYQISVMPLPPDRTGRLPEPTSKKLSDQKSVRPSGEMLGTLSQEAVLTSSTFLETRKAEGAGGRFATQISAPPLPPGRSELK